MASDCIFCKVVSGAIPAPRLYEDADFICIKDIQPQARTHLLVLPKKHVATLEAVYAENGGGPELMGKLFDVTARIAREQGLSAGGFRTVINTNSHGGQTVFHLHLHLLGGEPLKGSFGS